MIELLKNQVVEDIMAISDMPTFIQDHYEIHEW